MKKNLKIMLLSSAALLLVACANNEKSATSSDNTDVVETQTTIDESDVPEEVTEEEIEGTSETSEETESVSTESETSDDAETSSEEEASEGDDAETSFEEEDSESDDAETSSDEKASESDDAETNSEEEASESDDAETSSEEEANESDDSESTEVAEDKIEPVVVDMINKDGDSMGTATFEEAANGVILTLELEGLEEGEYGFHIHEYGQATPPTFMDALGHFNPTGADHGIYAEGGPHLGDFPNLVVGKDRKVDIVLVVSNVSLDPDAPYTLRTENGTSLIIHEGPDDYETQPIGTSGYAMIGGVIFAPLSAETEESEQVEESSEESEESKEDSSESSSEKESSSRSSSSKESSDDEARDDESSSEE